MSFSFKVENNVKTKKKKKMRGKVNGSVMFLFEFTDALIYDKIASQPQQIKPGMIY